MNSENLISKKQLNSPFQLVTVFLPEHNQGCHEAEGKSSEPKGVFKNLPSSIAISNSLRLTV